MHRRSESVLISERALVNCYEHERNDELDERVRTRARAGTRSGEGAEGKESRPPSAKAYKVGEEEDGEQASMRARTHTHNKGCVRMDGCCRRGVEG